MSAISEEREHDQNQMEMEVTENVKSSNLDVETNQEEKVSGRSVNFEGHSGVKMESGRFSSIVGGSI